MGFALGLACELVIEMFHWAKLSLGSDMSRVESSRLVVYVYVYNNDEFVGINNLLRNRAIFCLFISLIRLLCDFIAQSRGIENLIRGFCRYELL